MKIMLRWIFCLYCCFLLKLHANTFPQKTLSYSVGIGQPITTSTADTLDKGELDLSERLEYYSNHLLSNEVLLQNPLAENQKATFNNYLLLFYGFREDLTLGASLPFIDNSSLSAAGVMGQGITQLGSSYGAGDLNFFTMWRLLNEKKSSISLTLFTGINVPTGRTTFRDVNNSVFSATDQPGTGAWIPLAGIFISKAFKKFTLSTNLNYTQGTKGAQKNRPGSVFEYNVATVLELYKKEKAKLHLDGIMEFNGEYVTKNRAAGIGDSNSGGNTIYLLPGFRLTLGTDCSFYLGVNTPVLQHYYGIQIENQYGITGGMDIRV